MARLPAMRHCCWPTSCTWAKSGWRKSALRNCIILVVLLVLLIILAVLSAAQGQSIMLPTMIFAGTCGEHGSAGRVKTVLGLLVNITSTGILASSNFFMQVLNAPTREEVDRAHSCGSWLDVGIPSFRNTLRMKRWRLAAWLLLCISSTPIHLFFNSAIFLTDYQRSDYHITIASEDFVNGGVYHAPGASLAPAGLYSWDFALHDDENLTWFDRTWFDEGYYWKTNQAADLPSTRFGGLRNLSEYLDQSSEAVQNISSTAKNAGRWEILNTTECTQVYGGCDGLRGYRDVVLITESPGWQPDQVWHLEDNQTAFWESFMPLNESNSLWFSAQCVRYAVYNGLDGLMCDDTCWHMTNKSTSPRDGSDTIADLSFFKDTYAYYDNDSNNLLERIYGDLSYANGTNPLTSGGLVPGAADVRAKYCLAETVDDFCHVGVSNILLLFVVLCVVVKTGVAATVLYRSRPGDEYSTKPLVTVGDAIASFIEKPDPTTFGVCTLDEIECKVLMDPNLADRDPLDMSNLLLGPRCWGAAGPRAPRRFWSVIPRSVWITSYMVFVLVIGIAIYFLASAYHAIHT